MRRVKQTVIVKKASAATRKAAEKIARRHADRIYTSRETTDSWRFRQRPPSCFVRGTLRMFLLPNGKVIIVYGTLKTGAEKRKACR